LWVIKGILDKLGGKIEVKSSTTDQTGTCFSVFLELAKAAPAAIAEEHQQRLA
jgi:K+-sensing histidine kinase KdpD